jgi:DNA-binding CsgD family transcriptional regulator
LPDAGDHPRATLTAGIPLTGREREVLEHAALGLSNREIGERLHIAEQTVKNHLGNAMRKLSLHDRTHAVVFAIGSGLISLPVAGARHPDADEDFDALGEAPARGPDAARRT